MTKTQDGFAPATEGYQPGARLPLQKGYAPAASGAAGAQPPKPPSGGSSAVKPAVASPPLKT